MRVWFKRHTKKITSMEEVSAGSKILLCGLVLLISLVLGPSGCSQGFGGVRYSGGDGSSVAKAVVINGALDDEQGTLAEHRWLKSHYRGFTTGTQAMIRQDDRLYDEISFTDAKGRPVTIYFDITEFQGKTRQRSAKRS